MHVKLTVEHPDEVRVVNQRVSGSDEKVGEENDEVSVIMKPNAVTCKHAVMVSFKYADVTNVAVP